LVDEGRLALPGHSAAGESLCVQKKLPHSGNGKETASAAGSRWHGVANKIVSDVDQVGTIPE
jgi:hypothetical protein